MQSFMRQHMTMKRNCPMIILTHYVNRTPPELIDAYLNGQFCNLTSGTIYKNYDRKNDATATTDNKERGTVICRTRF